MFILRQSVFALLHAACVLLGLSPFDFWPLAFIAVFFILWAAHEQADLNLRKILLSGILFALALTAVSFFWIIGTIHRFTGENALLTIALSIAYALVFQTKPLLFFLAKRFLFRNSQGSLIPGLAIAAVLTLIDALNPELFVWSWGNTLSGEPHLRQLAAVGSLYLVSFAACFGGWLLFNFLITLKKLPWRERPRAAAPALLFMSALLVTGVVLRYAFTADGHDRILKVLTVQTNIGAAPETKRSDAAFATDAINRLFNQSLEGLLLHPDADLIVWPEASMPFHAGEKTPANAAIYSATLDGVLEYLSRRSGAAVVYQDMGYAADKLHSQIALRPAAGESYLKRRLVPWGEYLPLESAFPRLRNIFPEAGRFTAGAAGNELSLRFSAGHPKFFNREKLADDLAVLGDPAQIAARYPRPVPDRTLVIKPILCYEALFPSDSRTRDARLIVNLSSDAWFGDGIEGGQHAGAAVLRAVENGIPMVRAAMSGTSMVVDYRGDLIGRATGQGRPETLYSEIPLEKRKTIFSRFGMAAFYLLMFAALWPWLIERFRFFRTRENK